MPSVSATQLEVCPGATGEPHERAPVVGIGTEVRRRLGLPAKDAPAGAPSPRGTCPLLRDDKGRIVRGYDPHLWAKCTESGPLMPAGPWLKCQRCGVYSRPEGWRP